MSNANMDNQTSPESTKKTRKNIELASKPPSTDLGADNRCTDENMMQNGRLKTAAAGVHAIIELYDCPFDLLNDQQFVCSAIRQAAAAAGTHLLELVSRHFSPQGVTAIGLLAESHISIHTWPECGYAAADLFTCGQKDLSVAASRTIVGLFKAGRHSTRHLARGEQINVATVIRPQQRPSSVARHSNAPSMPALHPDE